MVILYILLAIVVLLLLILSLNARITLEYGDDVTVKIGTLFYDYKLIPSADKKKKTKKTKKSSADKTEKSKKGQKQNNVFSEFTDGLEITDFIEVLIKLLVRLNSVFKKHLRVRLKKYIITVAADSPDKAAILFGSVTAASRWLFEYLSLNSRLYPLEKSQVAVKCDFEEKKMCADLKVVIKIRLIHLLTYIVGAFFDFMNIKESKTIKKSSVKGTNKNERK